MTPCPGTGRRWQPGMGRAICPVCHASSITLGVPVRANSAAARRLVRNPKAVVPEHVHRAAAS